MLREFECNIDGGLQFIIDIIISHYHCSSNLRLRASDLRLCVISVCLWMCVQCIWIICVCKYVFFSVLCRYIYIYIFSTATLSPEFMFFHIFIHKFLLFFFSFFCFFFGHSFMKDMTWIFSSRHFQSSWRRVFRLTGLWNLDGSGCCVVELASYPRHILIFRVIRKQMKRRNRISGVILFWLLK